MFSFVHFFTVYYLSQTYDLQETNNTSLNTLFLRLCVAILGKDQPFNYIDFMYSSHESHLLHSSILL